MSVRVVGIAGGTASGKSTVARLIAGRLGPRCLLVAHDRYYHSASPDTNFDHPDALDTAHLLEDLARLRAGTATRLPVYDFARHARAAPERWDPVEPRPVLLVEGILILAVPALREALDLAVFVDAPADLRLARRIRRDVSGRGRTVHSVLTQYERTVRPMHEAWVEPSRCHAHLVLDGTSSASAGAARVIASIEAGGVAAGGGEDTQQPARRDDPGVGGRSP
ncbi:MAG: uridine kinase [Myxococcota bacterium]